MFFFTNPSWHRNIWTDLNPGPWRFSNPGFELSLFFSCLITTHVARCNLNQQLRHALKQIRQPVFIPSHEVDKVAHKVGPSVSSWDWTDQLSNSSSDALSFLIMIIFSLLSWMKGLVRAVVLITYYFGHSELWPKINPDLQLNGRSRGELF